MCGILLWPSVYVDYIQRFGITRFESAYGFRMGPIAVAQEGEDSWAITWVAPDGEFTRLGVRAGDVPVAYHGGIVAFYGALLAADEGETASFEVINVNEWPKRRDIELPGRLR